MTDSEVTTAGLGMGRGEERSSFLVIIRSCCAGGEMSKGFEFR